MKNPLYTSTKQFVAEKFDRRHSTLTMKSTDNAICILFLGVYYMELSNCFHGLSIYELEEEEVDSLLNYKKNINKASFQFFKIISNQESYYFAMLSYRIIQQEKSPDLN